MKIQNLTIIACFTSLVTGCFGMNTALIKESGPAAASSTSTDILERAQLAIPRNDPQNAFVQDQEITHQAILIVNAQNLLLKAALAGSMAQMQECIAMGALINRRDRSENTVLLSVLKDTRSSIDVVKFLLAHGADLDIRNNTGDTPLMLAVTHENEEVAGLCLAKTSRDMVATKNNAGETAFLLAIKARKSKKLLSDLITRGAQVNDRDATGNTALASIIQASKTRQNQSINEIELLLNEGADVGIANQEGITPLMYAIDKAYGSEAIARLCISKARREAVIKKDKRGRTALKIAIESPWASSIIPLLLQKEAITRDGTEEELIDFAFATCPDIVPLLAEKIRSYNVHTGVDKALRCGSAPAAEYFFKRGAIHGGEILYYHQALTSGNNAMIALLTQRGIAAKVIEGQRAAQIEFMQAAAERNPARMNDALGRGAQINWKDTDGNTALMYAFRNKAAAASPSEDDDSMDSSLSGITFLLDSGADIGIRNNAGDTPFICALRSGDVEGSMLCVKKASSEIVSFKDGNGETALMTAAKLPESKGVAKILISKGAFIDEQDNRGNSALMHAVKTRKTAGSTTLEDIDLLLEQGASVHIQNNDRETPLFCAVSNTNGCKKVALKLLSKASPHLIDIQSKNGTTALMIAAGNSEDWAPVAVARLLDLGANPLTRNVQGQNALDIALEKSPSTVPLLLAKAPGYDLDRGLKMALSSSNAAAVKVLLKAGAKNDGLQEAYLHAAAACDYKMLDVLFEHGIPVDSIDAQGRTALVIVGETATSSGWEETGKSAAIRTLLRHKANPCNRNGNGQTPLMLVAKLGMHAELVGQPQEALNLRDNAGKTALMYAIEGWCPEKWWASTTETIANLLKQGADAGAQDNNGDTVLMHACKNPQSLPLLKILLPYRQIQETVNMQNNAGQTALMLLAEKGASADTHELLEVPQIALNQKDKKGKTELMYAIDGCWTHPIAAAHKVVSQLFERRIDAGLQNQNGDTALIYACKKAPTKGCYPSSIDDNNHTTIEMLLAHEAVQATINRQNSQGETALHCALQVCERCSYYPTKVFLNIYSALLHHKASLTLEDNHGMSAFVYAMSTWVTFHSATEESFALIFEQAGEPIIRSSLIKIIQMTPEENQYNKFERALYEYCKGRALQLGDITDAEGKTAFTHAVEHRNWAMARTLADQTSSDSVNKIDDAGKSPLMRAVEDMRWSAIDTLATYSSPETIERLERDPACTELLFTAVKKSYNMPITQLCARLSQRTLGMKDNKGKTALWHAVNSLTCEHVEALAPRCSREVVGEAYEYALSLQCAEGKKDAQQKILQKLSDLGGKQYYEEEQARKYKNRCGSLAIVGLLIGLKVALWMSRR